MMAEIFITVYLVLGALAFALIWLVLMASKRRENKAKNINHGRLALRLFRKHNTKPSRFQT